VNSPCTFRGQKATHLRKHCARGGTRTAFSALKTLGTRENMRNPKQYGSSTSRSEAQSVDDVHSCFKEGGQTFEYRAKADIGKRPMLLNAFSIRLVSPVAALTRWQPDGKIFYFLYAGGTSYLAPRGRSLGAGCGPSDSQSLPISVALAA
jgi:hypothetical protein